MKHLISDTHNLEVFWSYYRKKLLFLTLLILKWFLRLLSKLILTFADMYKASPLKQISRFHDQLGKSKGE